MRTTFTCLLLLGTLAATKTRIAAGLETEVKNYQGSPILFVNGKPQAPMVFFGWAGGRSPTVVTIDTKWREYYLTFVAPEDNIGHAGIHFRVGGDGQGTVWADNLKFYPGPKVENPKENWVRRGDWEGTKEEIEKEWTLFVKTDAGAKAKWDVDPTTSVTGKQSCRIDIKNAGKNRMHIHFYQSGYTLKRGQQYTYSLWLKADRKRTVDFMALHIGPPWTIYSGGNSSYESQVQLASKAGVHIYSFGIPMPWPKPGEKPNFLGVDMAIEQTLRNDHEGLLLPRFGMTPPQWWLNDHPDDVMLFDDGKRTGVCVASEAWRKECLEHLRTLVRHCEEKYGDHILGYHPCGQHTGEWFYLRSWEPRLSDFSPAMNVGFRHWIEKKYKTIEALRKAWHDNHINFDMVVVPTKGEQLNTSDGFFRDPTKEQKVIDYFEYKQVAMEEPLEMMARVIKEETNRKKLVTFFYGYIFDMHGIPMGPQGSGHLAMAKMLKCPDVDILTSPISYNDRGLGGAGMFMCAVDSVRDAGKLWLNEDDTRTYLTPKGAGFGRVASKQGTYWVHQRNFAQLWPRRLACWYMDLGGTGWLNGADIWDNIAPMKAFYDKHIDEPAKWSPEVVAIVDEVSPYYTKCTRNLHSPLVYQMRSQLFRMGTPFRINLLSDLIAGRIPHMKVYIFMNCFHLTQQEREVIAAVTKGSTVVWFYGGGYISNILSDENITQAVGMKMVRGTPQIGIVKVEAGNMPITQDLAGTEFGTKTTLNPLWYVSDEGTETIGRYADGTVAAAIKKGEGRTSVYIGALHAPAKLLRNILRDAGVHLYIDSDDIVLTDGNFLAFVATSEGSKTLMLPHRCDVITALDEKPVAKGVKRLDLKVKKGETVLYLLKSR